MVFEKKYFKEVKYRLFSCSKWGPGLCVFFRTFKKRSFLGQKRAFLGV